MKASAYVNETKWCRQKLAWTRLTIKKYKNTNSISTFSNWKRRGIIPILYKNNTFDSDWGGKWKKKPYYYITVKWYMKCFSYILHGLIRTHKWPAPNVGGFIAQLVRASHRYSEVTGSNPVKSWLFQASVRNCLNCVQNCDDHGLLDLLYYYSPHDMSSVLLYISTDRNVFFSSIPILLNP